MKGSFEYDVLMNVPKLTDNMDFGYGLNTEGKGTKIRAGIEPVQFGQRINFYFRNNELQIVSIIITGNFRCY